MVRFNCTSCNNKLMVPDDLIGKHARCPQCKNAMIVPRAAKQNKESYVVSEDLGNKTYPASRSRRQASDNAILWMGEGMRRYFIFACVVIAAVTCIGTCIRYFRGAGDDSTADIGEVAFDPKAYAGQTLTSRATMMKKNHFAGEGGPYLALKLSPDVEAKAKDLYETIGSSHEVRITYRLYDWDVLEEIMVCQEAKERVRERSQRKISIEKERAKLEKPMHECEAIEKQISEAKAQLQRLSEEREQLVKDLSQFRAREKDRLERISEIDIRLQQLSEEKKELREEQAELDASEGENELQRRSEIKVVLQQLTEENKELTKKKDELQPEITLEAELRRLANEKTRVQTLIKNKEGQERLNKDKALSAEKQAESFGLAASSVRIVPPSTPYPAISQRRGRSGSLRRPPTASELRQEQRAREEREQYAAQTRKRDKLLKQEERQRRISLASTRRVEQLAKEQRNLQQLIKNNAEVQRTTKEKLRLHRVTKEKQESQWPAKEKQQLRQLAKEETNLQRLTEQKERLQPLTKDNAPRLAVIAEEIRKIEEADKNKEKIEFPVDSDGVALNDLNCSGVLLDIDVPRYR